MQNLYNNSQLKYYIHVCTHVSDLGVVGTACPQRMSAKERERQDERGVLAALQSEGLIQRPLEQKGGGVRFDIVEQGPLEGLDPWTALRPPARLAKLEQRTKKKRALTEEEISAKLERAERKRKVSKTQ